MTSCWTQRSIVIAAVAAFVGATGCAASAATQQDAGLAARKPDLTLGAKQFPEADAINLLWVTEYTLDKDGTVHRRNHRWLKLMNGRPIRAQADPRIDFREGQDKLIVHAARTHLPDGAVIPVPDYSFNLAGPDDVGRWPHYAMWCQQVICFSGLQDNAVIELDYEVVTEPGVLPWMEGDLRIDDDYPTAQRVVRVTVPEGTSCKHTLDGISPATYSTTSVSEGGVTRYAWAFGNLRGAPGEAQSPPWRERCPRFRFTTCPSADVWVARIIEQVSRAAQPDDAIRAFAEDAVEDEIDPMERVTKIVKKLSDSFNFVTSAKTYRRLDSRPAAEVFRSNYGSPLEAAAVCAAALRAAGVESSVEVAVRAATWNDATPTASALASVVVVAKTPDGPTYVHPQRGVFQNPGTWGRHWLLSVKWAAGQRASMSKTYIEARGEKTSSQLHISGKVTIDEDGAADGELRIHLTGAFYDPAALETGAQQERLLKRLVGRIASGMKVTDHGIARLSKESLRAYVTIASKDPLDKAGSQHVLALGDGPACLHDFPMPLDRSYRNTDVRLAGRFVQDVSLIVELPEGWSAGIVPATVPTVKGPWGSVGQQVEVDDTTVRVHQSIDVSQETISPQAFASLRNAVNHLRADASRVLSCGP